jgi:hypothetical protein
VRNILTTSSPPEPARETPAAPALWWNPAIIPVSLETAVTDLDPPSRELSAPAPAELVLVFASTTEVLNAEDWLEAENFEFALIPVPKEVNPNCGLALSIPEETAPDIYQALSRAGLSPLAVYRRRDEEFEPLAPDPMIP